MPPHERSGPEGPPRIAATKQTNSSIIARRQAAVARLAAQDRRLHWARLAHQAMPLTVYYGPRPLLNVPLGQLDARGRWAA